jgi:hypothetical protein
LHVESRVPNNATISAHVLIGDICSTDITLILDFDELSVYDSSQDLQYVSHDFVSRNRFYQSNLVICLEISNLFFYSTNHFEVVYTELKLSVDINLV